MDDHPQSLLFEQLGAKQMMRCPWCEEWEPRDSFTALQTPPNYPPPRTAPMFKHGNRKGRGCGMTFSLGPEA